MNYLKFFIFFNSSFLIAMNCDYCDEEIKKTYIKFNNNNYHDICYEKYIIPKCSFCKKSIKEKYLIEDNQKYHEHCYYNYIIEKCSICNKPLIDNYLIDSWNNKYHNYHKNHCNSCNRIISDSTSQGGFYINKDRLLCGICKKTIIKSKKDTKRSKKYVIKLLEKHGFLGISLDVPIQIVQQEILCNLYNNSNCSSHRGLTHYEYKYNAQTKIIDENSKENKIYILDYLPEIEFLSILAHEYLHVWLNINDLKYNSSITEGFCQLGSALIYESNLSEFSKVKLHEMKINTHPDYGIGYNKMKNCLDENKWKNLIEKMLNGEELTCFYK